MICARYSRLGLTCADGARWEGRLQVKRASATRCGGCCSGSGGGGSVPPLYRTTLKALAGQGVLATVGWKHGMRTSTLRASECINRHLHVHTHVWRYEDCPEIRDYMERIAWLPDAESVTVHTFDEAPRLAEEYSSGRISSYFPVLRVNPL
jgi:threonine dehydrogenase-like Zn-dependent dehydrogenase